jgi:hypothetical protein
MAQPLVASHLLADPLLQNQGILSRMLVTVPAPASGTREWHEPTDSSDAALRVYSQHLLEVLRLPEMPSEENLLALSLDAIAREMWIEFANTIEKQIGPEGKLSCIRGLANKAAEHAARQAGVLAIVEDPERTDVSARHLAAGIEIVNFYLNEALRLQATSQIDPRLQKAARLLVWLRKCGENVISPVEVYQFGPTEFRDKRAAEEAIAVLANHGHLIALDGVHSVRGIRRREVYRIVQESSP